jgi:undecaprenyl diphosphate synthase
MSALDVRRLTQWRTVEPPAPQESCPPAPLPCGLAAPEHVAVIMDGNGRWAQQRGLRREAGHRAGTENIRRVIERFCEHGVRYLTLFAFSTENWHRPKNEVRSLMRLPAIYLRREVKALHEAGVRLKHLGHLEVLDPRLQQQIRDAIELTKSNDRLTLSVAFNYGGRREIVDAVQRLLASGVAAEDIDEQAISANLDTAALPDPDLIIRTGGEMRLSNFLLWQSAYAEYYSTGAFWPDFDGEEVDRALQAYSERSRRFGAVS